MQTVTTSRSPIPLLILILLFGLPPAAGWLYIMNPQWLPDKHKNHGILVLPPRPLESLQLTDSRQQDFDWRRLSGRWTLVTRISGPCATDCREQLQALRQIRRALGAERIRVGQLLILAPSETGAVADTPETAAGDILVLQLSADQQAGFKRLFAVPGIDPEGAEYLIDPNGMLMMGYARETPKKDILKDLETLLKASRSWTTGADNGHR